MKRVFLILLGGLLVATWGRAMGDGQMRYAADEVAARRVHAMLDRDRWSQVIRITNTAPARTRPAVAWATVFELGDRLWIYLPREGTSSLSVYHGHLARDRADLTDVLRHRHAGFSAHVVAAADDTANPGILMRDTSPEGSNDVPNACFVRSVAWFQRLHEVGAAVSEAHLLLFYGGAGPTRWGHTVLCYETANGWYYWDPDAPARARLIPGGQTRDDLVRARRVSPGVKRASIEKARRFDLVATG